MHYQPAMEFERIFHEQLSDYEAFRCRESISYVVLIPWKLEAVPESLRSMTYMNPLSWFVHSCQDVLYHDHWRTPSRFLTIFSLTFQSLVAGYVIFVLPVVRQYRSYQRLEGIYDKRRSKRPVARSPILTAMRKKANATARQRAANLLVSRVSTTHRITVRQPNDENSFGQRKW